MSEAIQYFKGLQEDSLKFKSDRRRNSDKLSFLYDIGFSYYESNMIMRFRKYDSEQLRAVKERVDKHPYYDQTKLNKILSFNHTGYLSSILNGNVNNSKIIDEVERILDNYDKGKLKRLKK